MALQRDGQSVTIGGTNKFCEWMSEEGHSWRHRQTLNLRHQLFWVQLWHRVRICLCYTSIILFYKACCRNHYSLLVTSTDVVGGWNFTMEYCSNETLFSHWDFSLIALFTARHKATEWVPKLLCIYITRIKALSLVGCIYGKRFLGEKSDCASV